ncbi:MAG: hypothetical protein ABI367_07595 [Mucilaginibacter sp.]
MAFNREIISLPVYHTLADTDSVIRKRSIAVGISYGSDAMFFGRTGPIKYPFMSANAIYNTKGGFFVYGSTLRLLGYRTLVDEIDVGGGYLYHLTKKLSGTISYTHFIFNKEERVIESASAHDINLKNTYNWGLFKSSVTLDYLFGKESDIFATLNVSKYFETDWNVFDDKDYLTFNPGISVIVGTQNFVQRYSTEHEDRIAVNNLLIHGTDDPYPYNNGRFNALNYSFKIPVAYNRPHYTVEFSYKYSIPVNVEGSLMNKRESFFNLTFYYVFFK